MNKQQWSSQQTTAMCFVNFAAAFHSVDRDSIWRIMAADEMPAKLSRLIKEYNASTKAKVRATGGDSLSFEIQPGVRQGCAPSPTLFNYIINRILDEALEGYPGIQVGTNANVSDRAYADDIVLLSDSYTEMQGMLEAANRHAAAVGMRINASKSKVVSTLVPGEHGQAVILDGEQLEGIEKFKYLGSIFRAPKRSEAELILPVPHSLICNPVCGRGVKYRCVQRAGSTRQWCDQF